MPDMREPDVESFDCVIVGGGINGCGTFRDLCLQGLKVLMIERDDFCAGAHQASSRLMHGGLKYLETGEFRLVKEFAARAEHAARHSAACGPAARMPHSRTVNLGGIIGSAARFLGWNARLSDRGLVITALGLRLYDLYARAWRAMPNSRMLGRQALRRLMPGLHPAITGGGLYFEGHITHAERLGLEQVLDSEVASAGSEALNHAELVD